MSDTTEFHKAVHPEYAAQSAQWPVYRGAYRAGADFAQTAIIRHMRELDKEFEGRKARAYPLGLSKEIVDTRLAYLMKREPRVEPTKSLGDDWFEDVDLRGNDFTAFCNRVALTASVYGTCWAGADMPQIPETGVPRTAYDDMQSGVRPYLVAYAPDAVTNWGTNDHGRLEWALVKQPTAATTLQLDGPPRLVESSRPAYVLWTRETWSALDKNGAVIGGGRHPVGEVPLVPIRYQADVDGGTLGRSLIATVAEKTKQIINVLSLVSESFYAQTFSILTLHEDAVSSAMANAGAGVLQPGQQKPDVSLLIGPKRILTWRGEEPPNYISPDASQVKALMDWVAWATVDALRDAALIRGYAPDASGTSKAWDFSDTNQSLRSQAQNVADGMEYALWFAGRWVKKDVEFTVTYPDDFGVESGSDVLARFGSLVMADPNIPPRLRAAYLAKIARGEFRDLPETDVADIVKEIESDAFVTSGVPNEPAPTV